MLAAASIEEETGAGTSTGDTAEEPREAELGEYNSADIVLEPHTLNMLPPGVYSGDFFPEAEKAVIDGQGSVIDGGVYIWANNLTFLNITIKGNIKLVPYEM